MAKVLLNWVVGEVQAQHDLLAKHGWTAVGRFTRWLILDLDAADETDAAMEATAFIANQLDMPEFSIDGWHNEGAGQDDDGSWDFNIAFDSVSLNVIYPPNRS